MRAKLAAVVLALLLFVCSVVRGADVPRNTLKAEDIYTKMFLFEGVPCTNETALSIILESEADKFQAGRMFEDHQSYELCWLRAGPIVWLSIVVDGEAVTAHALADNFSKDEGI